MPSSAFTTLNQHPLTVPRKKIKKERNVLRQFNLAFSCKQQTLERVLRAKLQGLLEL